MLTTGLPVRLGVFGVWVVVVVYNNNCAQHNNNNTSTNLTGRPVMLTLLVVLHCCNYTMGADWGREGGRGGCRSAPMYYTNTTL